MMQAEVAGQLCKISLRDAHRWSDQTFIERNKIYRSAATVVLSSSSHLCEYRNQQQRALALFACTVSSAATVGENYWRKINFSKF